MAEQFAEGQADWDHMKAAEQSAYDRAGIQGWNHALWTATHAEGDCVFLWPYFDPENTSYYHAALAVAVACGQWEEPVYCEPDPLTQVPGWELPPAESVGEGRVLPMPEAMKAEYRAQAGLLREMFGNPFRPPAIDLSWLQPKVVQLAQEIYDQRSFERMPELANVLEEAGCTNADILAHCREGGEHVRGCWVLDLLLGKT